MVSSSCNPLLHSAGLKGRSLSLGAPFLGKHELQSSHPQPGAVINTCTTADLYFSSGSLVLSQSPWHWSSLMTSTASSYLFLPCLSPVPVSRKEDCLVLHCLSSLQGGSTTCTPRSGRVTSPAASLLQKSQPLAGLSLWVRKLSMGRNTLLAFSEVILAISYQSLWAIPSVWSIGL